MRDGGDGRADTVHPAIGSARLPSRRDHAGQGVVARVGGDGKGVARQTALSLQPGQTRGQGRIGRGCPVHRAGGIGAEFAVETADQCFVVVDHALTPCSVKVCNSVWRPRTNRLVRVPAGTPITWAASA